MKIVYSVVGNKRKIIKDYKKKIKNYKKVIKGIKDALIFRLFKKSF